MKLLRIKLLLILGLAFAFVMPGITHAGGADVTHNNYKENDCYKWSNRKYCIQRKGNWHGVNNPGGIRQWSYKYKYTYQYYINGKQVYEGSGKGKTMYKTKRGKLHLYKTKYKYNYKNGCFQVNYSANYQYVKGKIVRRKYNYSNGSDC